MDHHLWVEQPENTSTCLATKPMRRSRVPKHLRSISLYQQGDAVPGVAASSVAAISSSTEGSTRFAPGPADPVAGAGPSPAADWAPLRVIALARSPFKQKFGIPRQPGLAPAALTVIELQPPYNHPDAVRDIQGFSHVWLSWVFHEVHKDTFEPLVRNSCLPQNAACA